MGVFRRNSDSNRPVSKAIRNTNAKPITAAAAQIKLSDPGEAEAFRKRRSSTTAQWQVEAWEYYDAVGEIKYAFNLVANVVSRIRLYAAVVDNTAENPVPIRSSTTIDPNLADAAERALRRLESAFGGQAGLLRDAALNLSVAGECYLVHVPAALRADRKESWDIRSVDEVSVDRDGSWVITPSQNLANGQGMAGRKQSETLRLNKNEFVGRIWRPHPRYSDDPESSMRGVLDLCNELLLLNRTFRATARSRLNSGAMYLPDGLSTAAAGDPNYPFDPEFQDGPQVEMTPEETDTEFEDQLYDAMITPIKEEDSASAVVPLIMRGPAELGEKIKIFKFERSFDAQLVQRAERVLERILQGIDVPKDTVTGLANVKYSNAVQIDESLYKAHIEPLLLLISDSLTQVYLRQALRAQGYDESDVERVVVWYDPSAVATRNDRAADADSGYDKLAINGDVWRRAHGFSDQDAPSPTEMVLRLVTEKGSITPELSEALLAAFAPDIMNAARIAQQNTSVAPVPPEVQNALGGQSAAPAADPNADPNAATPDLAEPAAPADPEGAVGPGADAPPVDLAEPTGNNEA